MKEQKGMKVKEEQGSERERERERGKEDKQRNMKKTVCNAYERGIK
jgi:hypothetical protein